VRYKRVGCPCRDKRLHKTPQCNGKIKRRQAAKLPPIPIR
jgi:hypothetical protein